VNPTKVVFVCSGNICRSPYAEVAARARFDTERYVFVSAGSMAIPGMAATEAMRQVATERRLDLSQHSAQSLADIEKPDLVLAMEQEHLLAAASMFPKLPPGSIRLLDHPRAISDPYGRDLEIYRATADHIDRALTNLSL
jgi:protein-tyrosine-phosphatase